MPSINKETAAKLEVFRRKATDTAEDIIFNVFPTKILELTDLIESTSNPDSPYHPSQADKPGFTDTEVHEAPSNENVISKKRKLDDITEDKSSASSSSTSTTSPKYREFISSNKHNYVLYQNLKKEAEELAEYCDKVRLWINLTMPKIEDGDNFGVQIQEEVLGEIHRTQESAFNIRDTGRQTTLTRAKICSKIIKYPNLPDYRDALVEHDRKQLYYSRQHLKDIRNVYAIVTDILHKNITKLRVPKANNSVGLY